jgi:hypothetical protein
VSWSHAADRSALPVLWRPSGLLRLFGSRAARCRSLGPLPTLEPPQVPLKLESHRLWCSPAIDVRLLRADQVVALEALCRGIQGGVSERWLRLRRQLLPRAWTVRGDSALVNRPQRQTCV